MSCSGGLLCLYNASAGGTAAGVLNAMHACLQQDNTPHPHSPNQANKHATPNDSCTSSHSHQDPQGSTCMSSSLCSLPLPQHMPRLPKHITSEHDKRATQEKSSTRMHHTSLQCAAAAVAPACPLQQHTNGHGGRQLLLVANSFLPPPTAACASFSGTQIA